jgi:hypothetical protein
LERNRKLYRAAGLSPFGDTKLGRQLGPFGSSPLLTQILEVTFRYEDKAISAIAAQLQRRTDIPPIPPPTVTEQDFSKAFGGLRETSGSSPSGLYNVLYKCLASKKQDDSSHPARRSLSHMMALPMIHGFAPIRHLTHHECAIHKKPGNHKSETLRIIHVVEVTYNQSLKISVAWKIKQLVKMHTGFFMNSNSADQRLHAVVRSF